MKIGCAKGCRGSPAPLLIVPPIAPDNGGVGLSFGVASLDFGKGISVDKIVVMSQLKAYLEVVNVIKPAPVPKKFLEHFVYFDLNRASWSSGSEFQKLQEWKRLLEKREETKNVFSLIRQGEITIHIRAYTDSTGKVFPTNFEVAKARHLRVESIVREWVGGRVEIDGRGIGVHPTAAPVGADAASRVVIVNWIRVRFRQR